MRIRERYELAWFQSADGQSGEQRAKEAVQVLFACGGDGTLRSAASALVGTETALAVLPSGTGNVLALNLRLPSDITGGVRVACLRGGGSQAPGRPALSSGGPT
ncbi:MAG TPA: acylglycerol kinase family protein [Candidatus Dormibacteraeota bacterium]|nr:acylglycerol kinase family protein [Candidatus Dormibacteraeota bacterium]